MRTVTLFVCPQSCLTEQLQSMIAATELKDSSLILSGGDNETYLNVSSLRDGCIYIVDSRILNLDKEPYSKCDNIWFLQEKCYIFDITLWEKKYLIMSLPEMIKQYVKTIDEDRVTSVVDVMNYCVENDIVLELPERKIISLRELYVQLLRSLSQEGCWSDLYKLWFVKTTKTYSEVKSILHSNAIWYDCMDGLDATVVQALILTYHYINERQTSMDEYLDLSRYYYEYVRMKDTNDVDVIRLVGSGVNSQNHKFETRYHSTKGRPGNILKTLRKKKYIQLTEDRNHIIMTKKGEQLVERVIKLYT